ncbi:MAG: PEP-CTERM sorting domain-containing protein [Phycisphaerae bacterium]
MLRTSLSGGVLLAACSLPAFAGVPTAILQNSGVGDNSFVDNSALQSLQFDRFDRPVKSGNGTYWIMLARNTSGSSSEVMYITGSGTTYNLVAQEGFTEFEPGRTFDTLDRYVDINESGDWVGIGNLVGGPTNDDEVVYAGNFTGTSLSLPLREGQVVGTGDTLGSSNFGPSISDAGAVSAGFSTTTTTSIAYFTNNGNTVVLRNGDSVVGSATPFSTLNFGGRNAFQTTPDGNSYVVRGTLGASNGPQVLIKDGVIVLQQGDAYAGSTIDSILGEQNILEANGDWLTRARLADGRGVAIKNGVAIAASGDLVGGSVAGETWSEVPWTASSDTTFFIVTGDSAGNVVLGGFTDNPTAKQNFVWTYNGSEFLRAGDQIDLDGDGTLDDAFIIFEDTFSASPDMLGGFLADDGFFYSNIVWSNAAGDTEGNAFIRVAVPEPTSALALAGVALAGLRRRR